MRDFYLSSENLQSIRENTNPYVLKLRKDFSDSVFEEERAQGLKGLWKQNVFQNENPLDIEIGTGNGYYFSHHAFQNPDRNLIGFEIKYKCIYQTIRRAVSLGLTNAKMVRLHANVIDTAFGENEVDNVYIFFPDPWPKKRHFKNRLIQDDFLKSLYTIQKPGSFMEFKTDNPDYFEWSLEKLKNSSYEIKRLTYDLHNSEWAQENFRTHFENLWTQKGLKTMLFRAYKSN